MSKLKVTVTGLMLPFVLLFGALDADSRNPGPRNNQNGHAQSGTLQKMIVENASVTVQLDLNGLNGSNSLVARPVTWQFAAAPNSFFPILVFNDRLRAAEPGSVALVPQTRPNPLLPAMLAASLKQTVLEKLPPGAAFDVVVRDARTGLTFFNVEAPQYDYDPKTQSLNIQGGRLLISDEFAKALGRPSGGGAHVA